jgi:hypothetical protein
VGRLLFIDALGAFAVAALWYFCFARLNRRKGLQALRRVEAACSGQGRIVQARWLGGSRVQAQLRLASHWFGHARVTVRLLPRPLPFQWLVSVCRKQKETLTFEADLDDAPNFPLEVHRHRWFTHRHNGGDASAQDWTISRPGPVVFTTRSQWSQELPPVVHTFMTSRGHSLLSVRFRNESPHLAATIPLAALSDQDAAASFLKVLRELAAGASTSRH